MKFSFLQARRFARAFLLCACLTATGRNNPVAAETTVGAYGPLLSPTYPLLRVNLSRSLYTIRIDPKTGAPQMPQDVVATAQAQNWPAGMAVPTTFTWRVYLDWNFAPYPTHHRINNFKFVQPSPWKINLNEQIRGGQLTVIAKALLNGKEICGQARAAVGGENPSRALVLKAFPLTRFGQIASKIGMAESGLQQFNEAKGTAPGGMPQVSRTNDVGLMQLNAPTGGITSPDQVWDWRANVQHGMEMLREKRQITVLASRSGINLHRVPSDCGFQAACLNCVRQALWLEPIQPNAAALSLLPGSGALPGELDPDHLALNQVERDMIRRYNGGREYQYTLTSDDNLGILSAGWQIDPTRGGIRPRSGDPDYVHHVLLAQSGFTFPPLPKPKTKPVKKATMSTHRRRRRK